MNIMEDTMSSDVYAFLKSLIDPERFGHAVSAEVRDEVRVILGMNKVETVVSNNAKVGFELEED